MISDSKKIAADRSPEIFGKILGVLGLALALVTGAAGCRFSGSGASDTKFGWDEDIPDVTLPPPAEGQPKPLKPVIDRNFCKGVAPGKCLSLILHIPRPHLVSNLGLSTLALAGESKGMRARLDEACQAAWTEYKATYRDKPHYRQRNRLVQHVEKMRCIYIYDDQPLKGETLGLADQEIGLSVWLTDFAIKGSTSVAEMGRVSLQVNQSTSLASFRSASIFAGAAVNSCAKGWHLVEGVGVAPVDVTRKLERDVRWNVDFKQIIEDVRELASDPSRALASIKSFAIKAKTAFDLFQNSGDPTEAGMVLVGIGYHALQSLCKEKPKACATSHLSADKTKELNDHLASEQVPTSEASELFRIAVARSVQGILDQIMVAMPPQQLHQKFPFTAAPSPALPNKIQPETSK